MKITTVGIDLAKSVFSMHGIDEGGKAVLRRTVGRGKVLEVMAGIGPCLAVLATLNAKTDRGSAWVRSLIERRGYKRAAVALAAKNARTIWAMLAKGEAYRPSAPV